MTLIKCPDCLQKMSDNAEKCPHCGRPNSELREKRMWARHEPTWMPDDINTDIGIVKNKKKKKTKTSERQDSIKEERHFIEELKFKRGNLKGCFVWGLLIFVIWIIYNGIKAL